MAQKQITLEDIYRKGTFRAESVQGFQSMKDGRFYVEQTKDGIIKKSFENNETIATLIKNEDVRNEKGVTLSLDDIEWSDDETKILIFKDRESIYRRSSKAIAYVYDLATKKTMLVDNDKILHATLSPNAKQIAFVKNNNLYSKDLTTNKTVQITKDGKWNFIINGNCDWVYEEEFEFTRAFEWSKNSNYIAYYRFDESKVKTYEFDVYDSLYPKQYSYKYPKAGEANSTIDIYIYNTKTAQKTKVDIGTEKDIYIPRIKWIAGTNNLCVYWLNRLQNNLKLLKADAATGKTASFYEETNKYYVDINDNIYFFEDGNKVLLTSEKKGFNDLYLININTKTEQQLLKLNSEVVDLYGVNEKANEVYFSTAYMVKNRMPAVYNLSTNTIKPLREQEGTHRLAFNNDFSYFVDYYSTATIPTVISLHKTSDVVANSNDEGKILKNNKALRDKIEVDYKLPTPTFQMLKNVAGYELCSWMLKPASFDSTKKYPVLFCNYGGPGSQQVANRWGAVSMWHQYLAQQGYIVVCVDNTGTGFRGEEFKKKTYLQLGKYEIQDQIDVAKHLATLPYVDANRIGHWGWSFGGFMSSLAISKGADIFKTAVAVAPVTNWRYYDNIYTERFMRTPKENKAGYDENAPLNYVKNIKGKFLIIHGTADDNVHFQNSTMMVNEMIKKNIEFESGYYPNRNHGIYGDNATFHIYNKMTKFILQNL
ncbi:MAG: DPP IV N-terminal domain-containing protein [Bacteroidetes bacterium]|nr:DPP IV N-terminal domain-containing protein [Bacteroidota bacterium]